MNKPSHLAPVMTLYSVHYVLTASVGTSTRVINPVHMVIETRSEYNFIRKNAFPADCQEHVLHEEKFPAIRYANGNQFHIHHAIGLRMKFGVELYRIPFVVV